MSLRVVVTYPATDGSMPESVELTWDDGSDPGAVDLLAIVDRLLAAPAQRYSVDLSTMDPIRGRLKGGGS